MTPVEDVGLEVAGGEAGVGVVVAAVAAEVVGVDVAAGEVAGSGRGAVAEQFPCVQVLSAGVVPGC